MEFLFKLLRALSEGGVNRGLAVYLNTTQPSRKFYSKLTLSETVTRIHSVRIDNSTFDRVEEFKYLGTTLTNQNSIAEEIKSRLKSGNA